MSDRQGRLLELLGSADSALTAAELAERLGVTTRSVRNYISALKAAEPALVASGPDGYRIDRSVLAQRTAAGPGGPAARSGALLRMLVDRADGIRLFEAAEHFHVSESTIESDLTRARARIDGTGLGLHRTGETVRLTGTESAQRRLLGTLFREESARGMLELAAIARQFPTERLVEFKTALIAALHERGSAVNEYGLSNVLLHIAIAIDRVRRHRELQGEPIGASGHTAALLDELVQRFFNVQLGPEDLGYLGYLIDTRAATRVAGASARLVEPAELAALREIVVRAGNEFLVDLDDDEFLLRLALHIRNLIARAQTASYSRNPLTRSIKAAYPMTYDLAVYIAGEVARARDIEVNDDEIAYIAMHVGALVEQRRRVDDDAVGVTVVSPAYYDVHLVLLERLQTAFGAELVVEQVLTRTDVDWATLPGELVLSTVPVPLAAERSIVVKPFLADADIDRIRSALARLRRARRRTRLTEELLRYFDERLFVREPHAAGPQEMIRLLGERMLETGIIDQSYLDGALERERLSSTAFVEGLAVPHALAMTATRTSIAIAITDAPIDWNGTPVNVVAFIAFSEADRSRFQNVFDQFVEVFAERDAVSSLLHDAVDFDSFIDALAHVMES